MNHPVEPEAIENSAALTLHLQESEARYRAALLAGRMGSWETDFRRGLRIWTDEGLALFGLTLEGNIGHAGDAADEWLDAVHPDDREQALQLRAQAETLDSFPAEYRIRRPDGAVVWLSGRGQVSERDGEGRPLRLVSIMADISERKRSEAALRDSENRFRSIFENVAVGMAHTDLDGRWLVVNQRLCDILGHARDDLMRTAVDEITHAEDRGRDQAEMARLIAQEIEHSAFDVRYLRRDGTTIWVGRTISLVRDEAGAPQHFISVFRDVSERRQAQEHQRFLLAELSHRSKNLLTVIQALASQTIRSVDSLERFRDSFMNRIHGLAATQDLLVNQNWTGGDLAQLAASQLDLFNSFGDGRIRIGGPPVALDADTVQAVGLALHELATNAVKYGALSSPGGTVDLSWALVRDADATAGLRVCWSEHGGPPVTTPRRTGFGSVVLDRMVSTAVGGSVEVDYAVSGLRWVLNIPSRCFEHGATGEMIQDHSAAKPAAARCTAISA